MNKVLLEVFVPAGNKNYDIYVPENLKVFEANQLIVKLLNELSEGVFKFDDQALLCERSNGSPISMYKTIRMVGLKNGSSVMLL
ncbi:MAG: methyltransferase [Firmicutes bacterium HGW-Firmicutes-3]|jgi:hypothetical protein|nr:MAG: methyltransferase [Firmicutes bacterium HGW-Firmicutes-3]